MLLQLGKGWNQTYIPGVQMLIMMKILIVSFQRIAGAILRQGMILHESIEKASRTTRCPLGLEVAIA
jgi:hypothetical protein